MIETIGDMVVLAGLLLLALSALASIVPWIKSKWPAAVPPQVSDVLDKVADYADETTGAGACLTLAILAKKRANAALSAKAAEAWALVVQFPAEPYLHAAAKPHAEREEYAAAPSQTRPTDVPGEWITTSDGRKAWVPTEVAK